MYGFSVNSVLPLGYVVTELVHYFINFDLCTLPSVCVTLLSLHFSSSVLHLWSRCKATIYCTKQSLCGALTVNIRKNV